MEKKDQDSGSDRSGSDRSGSDNADRGGREKAGEADHRNDQTGDRSKQTSESGRGGSTGTPDASRGGSSDR